MMLRSLRIIRETRRSVRIAGRISSQLQWQFVAEKSTFLDLGVHPAVVKELAKHNIVTPTKIQEEAIPIVLKSKNTFITDKTGTGKTLCYLVPILHNLAVAARKKQGTKGASQPASEKKVTAIVIAPNSHLAAQICNVFNTLAQPFEFTASTLLPHSTLRVYPETKLVVVSASCLRGYSFAELAKHAEYLVFDNFWSASLDLGPELGNTLHTAFGSSPRLVQQPVSRPNVMLIGATLHARSNGARALLDWVSQYTNQTAVQRIVQRDSVYRLPSSVNLSFTKFDPSMKIHSLVVGLKNHYLARGNKTPRVLIHCQDADEAKKVVSLLDSMSTWHTEMDPELSRVPAWWEGYVGIATSAATSEGHAASAGAVLGFRTNKYNVLLCTGMDMAGVDILDISAVIILDFDGVKTVEEFMDIAGRTGRNGAPGEVICMTSTKEMDKSPIASLLEEVLTVEPCADLSYVADLRGNVKKVANRCVRWRRTLNAAGSGTCDPYLERLDECVHGKANAGTEPS